MRNICYNADNQIVRNVTVMLQNREICYNPD